MKEYLTKKYQTAKQFSIFGAGDEAYKRAVARNNRMQANANRVSDDFARLTPPFAAHLRLSTANLETFDLISDGPIEGFFNSQGKSCGISEATFYDDTVIAEPSINSEIFANLRFSKLSGASLDSVNFVSGKLKKYENDLRDRFVHRIGVNNPESLFALSTTRSTFDSPNFSYPNQVFNVSPYTTSFGRYGRLEEKHDIDTILNWRNNVADRRYDYWMFWGAIGETVTNEDSFTSNNNKGVSNSMLQQDAYGHRKQLFQKRKIYYCQNAYDVSNIQNGAWKYNPNNPKLYQGNFSYGHGITRSGSVDGAYCTRSFLDTVAFQSNTNSTERDNRINFLRSALQFDGSWPYTYNSNSDARPSNYVYTLTPGSDLGDGLKEPIINSIASRISSLGVDYYKSYKYYNTEIPFRNWGSLSNYYYDNSNLNRKGGRMAAINATVGGQSCVKIINIGTSTSPLIQTRFTSNGDRRIEFISGQTYRITGEYYLPSSNSKVDEFRMWGLRTAGGSNKQIIKIKSGDNATLNSWVGFTGAMTNGNDQDRYFRIQLYTTSSFTNNGTDSGDFIGLRNLEIQQLVTGSTSVTREPRYGYLEFNAQDHFNGGSSYQFNDSFNVDFALNPDNVVTNAGGAGYLQNLTSPSEKIILDDTRSLGYSYPEVTGFDLVSQNIKESIVFGYQAAPEEDIGYWYRVNRPLIVTGSANAHSYGTELKESKPQGFEGAFLYPVYLGENLIPLNSDQTIDTGKIFITTSDSAAVSGNKLQSGIDNDYDVFQVVSDTIRYSHVANPKIKSPKSLVTGKAIGLSVKQKEPTLFNFTNVDLNYVLGNEVQPSLDTKVVTEIQYNKNLFGPSNPNVGNDTTLDSEGFKINTALNVPDIGNTVSTSSRDVEGDGTDQANWMNNIGRNTDEYFSTHLVNRRCVDSVKIGIVVEALSEDILQQEQGIGGEVVKLDAAGVTIRIRMYFEGVSESVFPPVEIDFYIYGMVTSMYATETEELKLPSYDDLQAVIPNVSKKQLHIMHKRKIDIHKLDYETTSVRVRRQVRFFQVKEIINEKFNYPFSAIVRNKIDARTFAETPRRTYNARLKKVQIPSNYYPLSLDGEDRRFIEKESDRGTRKIYDGDWDGSFKIGWTDNPAWILYDLMTNTRYGIGNTLDDLEDIDIFNLYKIGRYCDAVDSNGNFIGVKDGFGGLEPRYSCNVLFEVSQNAFEKIKDIASVFNGMAYWANGSISFFTDEPKEPTAFFNNGNVFDGIFTYTDTSTASHYNVADVVYLDKRDNFNQKVETVEFEDGRRTDGIKRRKVNAKGATSRGQARRLGRYMLYSNLLEREIVQFKTSSQALLVNIGDIIEIEDELKNFEVNYSKILEKDSSDKSLVLQNTINDQSILTNGSSNAFVVVPTGSTMVADLYDDIREGGSISNAELENLSVEQGQKLPITGVESVTNGIKIKLNDSSNVFQHIRTGTFCNVDLQHRRKNQYRVMSMTPVENNLYDVTATEYNSGKFAVIENPEDFTLEEETGYNIGIIENTIKTLSEPEGFSTSIVTDGFSQRINFNISGNLTGNEEGYEVTVLYPNAKIDKKRIEKQNTTQNGFIKTTGSIGKVDTYGTFTFEVRSLDI